MASLIRQDARLIGPSGSLWQGGVDDVTSGESFDVIILCAEEFQPEARVIASPDKQVVYAPNDDSGKPLSREQAVLAIAASRIAANRFREGKKVLVSCMQGRNRSGLVMALTLHRLYGLAGDRCAEYVKRKRADALTNVFFTDFLAKIKGRS